MRHPRPRPPPFSLPLSLPLLLRPPQPLPLPLHLMLPLMSQQAEVTVKQATKVTLNSMKRMTQDHLNALILRVSCKMLNEIA